ncbi:hypothetical protein Btru_054585 [Bulinus truncatus]|nr:hypothetical protein Btru_054585 [Bulinus truncatus]
MLQLVCMSEELCSHLPWNCSYSAMNYSDTDTVHWLSDTPSVTESGVASDDNCMTDTEALTWMAYLLTIISDGIVDYYLWVVCAVGIPGNVLTIFTVLTMETISPATILVVTLSFFDVLTLSLKFIGMQFYLLRISVGSVGCIVSTAAIMFLGSMSNWTLIMITGERCIAVCFPLKRVYLLTKRRVYNAIAGLSTSLLAVSLATSIVTVDEVTGEWYCSPDVEHGIYYWVIGTLYVNVPFVSITVLTSAVLRGLRVSSKRHMRLLHDGPGSGTGEDTAVDPRKNIANRTEVTLTTMMVSSGLIFIVLFLPALIVPVVLNPPTQDSTGEAQWRLFSEIRYVLLDLSHAINFFLYFVTAKKFRSHVLKMLSVRNCLRCLAGKNPIRSYM